MRNGRCLYYEKDVTTRTAACEEAVRWTEDPGPNLAPLGVPVLAGVPADGSPSVCADCCMFQPEGQPLGLVIFPVEDLGEEGGHMSENELRVIERPDFDELESAIRVMKRLAGWMEAWYPAAGDEVAALRRAIDIAADEAKQAAHDYETPVRERG